VVIQSEEYVDGSRLRKVALLLRTTPQRTMQPRGCYDDKGRGGKRETLEH
jgi:hypothetical protein